MDSSSFKLSLLFFQLICLIQLISIINCFQLPNSNNNNSPESGSELIISSFKKTCPEGCVCQPLNANGIRTGSLIDDKSILVANCTNRLDTTNLLTNLPDDTTHLNLSYNQLRTIANLAFHRLKQLLHLTLSHNQLSEIDDYVFDHLQNLKTLRLNDNWLKQIPSSIAKLSNLTHLYLSNNRINHVEKHAFNQNQQLELLDIRGNPIQHVNYEAFSSLPKLKKLVLSTVPNLKIFPNLQGDNSLEHLVIDRCEIRLIPEDLCLWSPNLKSLVVKSNRLTQMPMLRGCTQLRMIDLSYNYISRLNGRMAFGDLPQLLHLFLRNNMIQELGENSFEGLKSLEILDLEWNSIDQIHPKSFAVFTNLQDLNLGHNHFSQLPTEGLQQVLSLKVHNNPNLRDFPARFNFPRVRRLALSYAYHCCAFQQHTQDISNLFWNPLGGRGIHERVTWLGRDSLSLNNRGSHTITVNNRTRRTLPVSSATFQHQLLQMTGPVHCIPQPGPFLPCEDLFDYWTLRCGVWLVFLLALLGNSLVITVLCFGRTKVDVPRFLVCNLAFADLLMGLYLAILAVVDASTLGSFRRYAVAWQHSAFCSLAGFLAVFSTELSVFTLAVLTLERNYAITHAMHLNKRLSLKKSAIIMGFGYVFAFIAAVAPLLGLSSYRRFAVCLPFEVQTNSSLTYVLTLVLLNGLAFIVLIGCYLRMYCAIRGSQAWNSNDSRIARRMALLVFTDLFCWAPIAICTFSSLLFDFHLITLPQAKIFTIFVLPLNACADPFLYAIFTKQFKKDCVFLCKRLEESRVSRGIGACRHSSNFSARHTPIGSAHSGLDRRTAGLGALQSDQALNAALAERLVNGRLRCTPSERQHLLQRLASTQPLLCRCSVRPALASADPMIDTLLYGGGGWQYAMAGKKALNDQLSPDDIQLEKTRSNGWLSRLWSRLLNSDNKIESDNKSDLKTGTGNAGFQHKIAATSDTDKEMINEVLAGESSSANVEDRFETANANRTTPRNGECSEVVRKVYSCGGDQDCNKQRLDSNSSSDQYSSRSDSWRQQFGNQLRLWEQLCENRNCMVANARNGNQTNMIDKAVRDVMLESYEKQDKSKRARSCSSTSASASCSTTTFRMSRSSVSSDGGRVQTILAGPAGQTSRKYEKNFGGHQTDTGSSLDGNVSASAGDDSLDTSLYGTDATQEQLVGALLQQFLCNDCSDKEPKTEEEDQRRSSSLLFGRMMDRLNESLQEDELKGDGEVFINSSESNKGSTADTSVQNSLGLDSQYESQLNEPTSSKSMTGLTTIANESSTLSDENQNTPTTPEIPSVSLIASDKSSQTVFDQESSHVSSSLSIKTQIQAGGDNHYSDECLPKDVENDDKDNDQDNDLKKSNLNRLLPNSFRRGLGMLRSFYSHNSVLTENRKHSDSGGTTLDNNSTVHQLKHHSAENLTYTKGSNGSQV